MATGGQVPGVSQSSTDGDPYCTPCEQDQRQERPAGYCETCSEYLCSSCVGCHKRFRLTRGHPILLAGDMPTHPVGEGPPVLYQEACNTHPGEYLKYFCRNHDLFGCSTCVILQHRNCSFDLISKLAKKYSESEEYKTLTANVRAMSMSLVQVKQDISDDLNEVDIIQNDTLRHIDLLREKLNNAIDTEEAALRAEVAAVCSVNRNAILEKSGSCEKLLNKVNVLSERLKGSLRDEVQTFMTAKSCINEVSLSMLDINSLNQGPGVLHYDAKLLKPLQNVLESGKCFAKIVKPQYRLNDTSEITMEAANNKITGMARLTSNKLIAVDYYSRQLILIDVESLASTASLKVVHQPWDVAAISNQEVAVTVPLAKEIMIVAVEVKPLSQKSLPPNLLSQTRSFFVERECRGICYHNGHLLLTCDPGTVLILTLDGDVVKRLNADGLLVRPLHIAAVGNGDEVISVSDIKSRKVVFMQLSGTVVGSVDFDGTDPRGVVALGKDKLGICSVTRNQFVIIGRRQGRYRILGKVDGVKSPLCAVYCEATNTLYISCADDSDKMFIRAFELVYS